MTDSVPSLSEQLEEIREIEKKESIKEGEKAYLIDAKWYKSWQRSCGYYASLAPTEEELSEIDNSTIFDKELKPNLREDIDYVVLVKGVWDLLFKWYGGGPEVAVDVIYDPVSKKSVAVVNQLEIRAIYGKEEKTLKTPRCVTVKNLKEKIMNLFGVPEDTETRLIDWWNGHWTAELKDENPLSKHNIIDKQQVLLDEKKDGKWQHESASTSSYNSSYYRNYGSYTGPGKVGFRNLGNTCFFNSGVQCLVHTMSLANVFLNTDWQKDLNTQNPLGSRGRVATAFADVVKEVWRGQYGVIEPSQLKYEMGRFAEQFAGWGQQDSHELITAMLDAIHEDLNRRKQKPQVEAVSGNSKDDLEVARKSWINHKLRNDSVIVDRCHGLLKSQLDCPLCGATTVVFDPYSSVPLPLQKTQLQKVRALFIPLDPKEKMADVVLMLPSAPKTEHVSKALSELLGREVHAVLAQYGSSGKLVWNSVIDTDSTYYYSSRQVYVFEIGDSSRFWVPCAVTCQLYNQWKTYASEEMLYGPFLMPMDDDNVTEEDVAEAAQEYLAWMWKDGPIDEEDDDKLTQQEKEFKDRISPPKDSFGSGIKLRAKFPTSYYDTAPFQRSKALNCVGNKLVTLKVSADYFSNARGFDVNSLIRRFSDIPRFGTTTSRGGSGISLDDCFKFFATSEVLDEENKWFCPKCREFVCAKKKMDVWSTPDVLIIQLKRFIAGAWTTKKLEMMVDYPDEMDMSKYIVGPQKDSPQIYKLYAVSEHMGGLGGGHYIAHAAVQDANGGEQWYEFNDSSVSLSSKEDAHSELAYVLFYVRKGSPDSVMSQWGSHIVVPEETGASHGEEEDSSDPQTTESEDSSDSMLTPD